MAIDRNTGLVTWTPGATGSFTFTVVAEDNRGGMATKQFSLTVNSSSSGDTPSIDTSSLNGPAVAGVAWQQQIVAHDPQGSPLVYSLNSQPSGMEIDPLTGMLTWTPTAGQVNTPMNPSYNLTVGVRNGAGGLVQQMYTISVVAGGVNDLPVIVNSAPTEIEAGRKYVYLAQASDADGDPITWSLPNAPTGMTITSTGAVIWQTTAANVGTYLVSVEAVDGRGGDDGSRPFPAQGRAC